MAAGLRCFFATMAQASDAQAPEKKLFLLDAMALIYRAHFAFSKTPRINSKGQSTGATFGFTNTLLEVIQKERPTHLGVAFDTDKPTFRHTQFEAYKANRQAQPEDIQLAIPYVYRILEGFGIPALQLDGYEADDVIGTLAWQAADQGFTVYMMTPDKDYGQLVRDNVFLYKPSFMGKGVEVLGPAEICARWDIENVGQVRDVLGLMGDAVDNIPGIPGIGEKTAIKLIKEYGSVENLLANADSLKGKLAENLKTYADQGRLSKELACIETKVPIPFDPEGLALSPWNKQALADVFAELEFRQMASRLLGEEAPPAPRPQPATGSGKRRTRAAEQTRQMDMFGPAVPAGGGDALPFVDDGASVDTSQAPALPHFAHRSIDVAPHHYVLIDGPHARKELVSYLLEQHEFCFDTETDGLDPKTAGLVGLSFCYRKGEAYYVHVAEDEATAVLEDLRPALEHPGIVKIGQNIKFDMAVLSAHGIKLQGPLFDTMIAHYLLEPEQRHGMDVLAQQYLNYTPVPIEDLIGKKGKGQRTMRDVPLEQLKEYAAEDADITFQLKQILAPKLVEHGLDELLSEVEMPLVEVLCDMESTGVCIDTEALKELSVLMTHEAGLAEEKIYQDAGERFNIGSPKQLGEVLFERMRLDDKPQKTPSGQYATGEEVLTRLAVDHAIAADILEYRQIVKLKSTYVDSLPELIAADGRVHTSYNQAVAATGRLSSTNPNLQNIPIRTDRGREIRKAFVARDADHRIVSADYSQIELRIMASFSGDETMIEAFRQNKDIHAITASRLYHIPVEEVNREQRNKAKTANFGIIYGISAFGLSQRLKIPRAEASELIKNYFLEFPAVKSYMDGCIAEAREREYVTTLLGRRRYLRDINSRNSTMRGFAERNAVNAPIQGTAADMIKIAMVRIHQWLAAEKLRTKMILQVHDELVFDAPVEELDYIKAPILKHMAEALVLKVPIEVGFGIGTNWLDAH